MEEQDKGIPRSSSASAIFPRSSSASSLSPQAPPPPRPLQTSASTTTLPPPGSAPLYELSGSSPRSPLSLVVPGRSLQASPRSSPTSSPQRPPFNSLGRQGSSPALLPSRDPPPPPASRSPSSSHSKLPGTGGEGGSLPTTPSRSPSTSHSKLPGTGSSPSTSHSKLPGVGDGPTQAPGTPSRSLAGSYSKLPDPSSFSQLPGLGAAGSYSKLPETSSYSKLPDPSSYSKLPGVGEASTSSYSKLPGTGGEVREPSYPRLPGLSGGPTTETSVSTSPGATATPSRAPVTRQFSQPALNTRRTSSIHPPPSGPPPAAPRRDSASASLMRSASAGSMGREPGALPLAIAARSAETEGEVVSKQAAFKRAQSASQLPTTTSMSTSAAVTERKAATTEWKFDPSKWKEVPRTSTAFDPLMNPLGGFESKDDDGGTRKTGSPTPGSSPARADDMFEVASRKDKESRSKTSSPTEPEFEDRDPTKDLRKKQQALIASLVHESNPVVIEKAWGELSDEDKRVVVMDHFMVKTQTTRGLEENDYQTLLRVNRAINGELKKSDPEDRSFGSRYGDMTSSLPKSQGGVWILIRTIEDKLRDPVLANMWQEFVIYGLIDGSQAEAVLHSPKTLLFRFSLRHAALCITSKRMHDSQVAFKHDLLNDGFGVTEEKKWREYKVVLTTRKSKEMEGIYSSYISKEKTTERDKQFHTWHDARYAKW